MNVTESIVVMILLIVSAFIIGIIIGIPIGADSYRKEAISRGYAIHNPTNGNWQWVEPNKIH